MREKRAANAAIFYYQEFGYIIGSRTEYLVSEHPTIVNPVMTLRKGSFVTLHDTLVEYQKPSDDFEDAGDGGTDAYQIFVYEENSRNYIAFLMDHQYTAIHKSVIQKRWKKMFGNLLEFQFRETQNGILKFKARGKTNVSQIESYLFQDGDTFMEVMTEIDILNTSVKEQKEIAAELNQTINSITMKQEG